MECSWVTGNGWLDLPCWNSSLWLRGAQVFWMLPSLQPQAALLWAAQGVVWIPSSLSHTLLLILQEPQGFMVCRQDSTESGKGCKPIWGSMGRRRGKVGLSWQIPTANPSRGIQTALRRDDRAPQSHTFFSTCWFFCKGPKAQCSKVVPTVNNAPNPGISQVFTRTGNMYEANSLWSSKPYQVTKGKARFSVDKKPFWAANNMQILRTSGFQDISDLKVLGQSPLEVWQIVYESWCLKWYRKY